jgi:hypothetical protein
LHTQSSGIVPICSGWQMMIYRRLDNARLNLLRYLSPKLPANPAAREQVCWQRRIAVEALNAKLERLLLSAPKVGDLV